MPRYHTRFSGNSNTTIVLAANIRQTILRRMLAGGYRFGCYFTIGVEVLYSDYIKAIAKAIPDHLLLTETDNPGALRWLKKHDHVGMPTAIKDVVKASAELRQSTFEQIEDLVFTNFSRLLAKDVALTEFDDYLNCLQGAKSDGICVPCLTNETRTCRGESCP